MPYAPIVATLGYLHDSTSDSVLMVHRNRRPGDFHLGKYNGLGGKLERGEDVVAGIRREILEEAGVAVTALELRGTVNWPGFGKGGEDWLGFVFRITGWEGEVPPGNDEGTLHWVPRSELLSLNLWEGDRHFLPLVFDTSVGGFHGVMPYSAGRPVSWHCSTLPAARGPGR